MVTVEALILGVNQGLPEGWVYIVVAYRGTVLAKEFTNLFAISADNHRSLGRALVLDGAHRGALTKQPQQVDIYCHQIQEESHHQRCDSYQYFNVPGTSLIQAFIPWPEAFDFLLSQFQPAHHRFSCFVAHSLEICNYIFVLFR